MSATINQESQVANQKLCWKCEKAVHVYALRCPYCRSDLTHPVKREDFNENSASRPDLFQGSQSAPLPPYALQDVEDSQEEEMSQEDENSNNETSLKTHFKDPEFKTAFKALAFLLSGSVFILFALLLFLFSHDGYLTLKWKSQYWPIYFLLSLALLYWGWKALGEVQDEENPSV